MIPCKFALFPVFRGLSGNLNPETGSLETASTANKIKGLAGCNVGGYAKNGSMSHSCRMDSEQPILSRRQSVSVVVRSEHVGVDIERHLNRRMPQPLLNLFRR